MNSVDLKGIGMTSQRTRERLIQRLVDQGISNFGVLDVIRTTPRHLFLDEAMAHRAYEDVALPIGFQQTLSQPYIVARMTELLLAGGSVGKVLEVGTGSGYQTAVLAPLVGRVYSIERIKSLHNRARAQLQRLKVQNALLRHGDGGEGWRSEGPFNGILSAAASAAIPAALLDQLALGGRLIMPVGDGQGQQLEMVTRTALGFQRRVVESVNFVPFVRGAVG